MIIQIPEGTVTIPAKHYMDESQVREFKIPASLDTIGEQAFMKSRKESKTFPEELKEIHAEAFYGMTDTNFIFKGIPKHIGERAFVGKNLTLTMPNLVCN